MTSKAKRKADSDSDAKSEKKVHLGGKKLICDTEEQSDFVILYKGVEYQVQKSVMKMGCAMFKDDIGFDIDKESKFEVKQDLGEAKFMATFLDALHNPFRSTLIRDVAKVNVAEMATWAKLISYFGHIQMLEALTSAILKWHRSSVPSNAEEACCLGDLAMLMAPRGKSKATLAYAHLLGLIADYIDKQRHERRLVNDYGGASTSIPYPVIFGLAPDHQIAMDLLFCMSIHHDQNYPGPRDKVFVQAHGDRTLIKSGDQSHLRLYTAERS